MFDSSSIIYNLSSDFRIETSKEFIKRKVWVKEGLGMQIDIHEPHEENVNWNTAGLAMDCLVKLCGVNKLGHFSSTF